MRVRVVDDNAEIVAMLEHTLQLFGNGQFEVDTINRGFEGLFNTDVWVGIDGVLLDLSLNGHGIKLLEFLRESAPWVWRVVFTAAWDAADDPAVISAANVVLKKPAPSSRIIEALAQSNGYGGAEGAGGVGSASV